MGKIFSQTVLLNHTFRMESFVGGSDSVANVNAWTLVQEKEPLKNVISISTFKSVTA
jgi:hypothetical protein